MDERPKFKKLKLQNSLKKNTGINLHVLGWGNEFLSYDTKARQQKEIIGKLDFIEIKNFHASKDTIKKVKRQTIEWEKIFVNYISDKTVPIRVCKELLHLNNKKTNGPI